MLNRFMSGTMLLAALLSVVACASPEVRPVAHYVKPVAGDRAIVYFFRGPSMPTAANVTVEIDGNPVALLPNKSFTWVGVKPGKTVVRVGYNALFSDFGRKQLELDLKPGETYVVRYHGSAGGPRTQVAPMYGLDGRVSGMVGENGREGTWVYLNPPSILNDLVADLVFVNPNI